MYGADELNVPYKDYSLDSFLEYVVDHKEEVFANRKWLKIFLVYSTRSWRDIFEKKFKMTSYGDMYHIAFNSNEDDETSLIDYYIYELASGLLMFFTSSRREDYEHTLKNFIKNTRGISESWLRPRIFDDVKDYIVSNHSAIIYRFISRRNRYSNVISTFRPDYDRRISYSGEDAKDVLKEIKELYGAQPVSIDFKIGDEKFQINNNGMFLLRTITRRTVGIIKEVTDKVITEQLLLRNRSERFNTNFKSIHVGNKEVKVSRILAGKIIFSNRKLDKLLIEQMFKEAATYELGKYEDDEIFGEFSFIDTFVTEEKTLSFSAIVVDEMKGTIFGLSGSETEVVLVPKHDTTFESFLRFYQMMVENFDNTATLTTFSEKNVR